MKRLSVPPERPVEPLTADALATLSRVAAELSIRFCVAGATARDLVLFHVMGWNIVRATRDLDLAIHISGWAQFDAMKAKLVESGEFIAAGEPVQRLRFAKSRYPVDLIPFGEVATDEHVLRWPPNHDVVMNVAGYAEALEAAWQVQIQPDLIVPVVSIPSLTALKIFAWLDRGANDRKDALDLALILHRYHDVAGEDLWAGSVLESVDYDRERGGAVLLGQHTRRALSDESAAQLLGRLDRPAVCEQLKTDVAAGFTSLTPARRDDAIGLANRLLEDFMAGFSS